MNLGNRFSQHSFSQIPDVKMARSQFDRSFTAKDTFDFDYLVPFFVDEIIPGDTINMNLSMFARLSSQATKVPVMDNMMIDTFWFFVPCRLVWDNWEKFNGAQTNPGDSTDFLIPQITSSSTSDFTVDNIYGKMGIPNNINGLSISALPFRCYALIYNEWFRDQNLTNSIPVPTDDGPDLPSEYALLLSAKKHDYFTSLLPWPQKGPAVSIPLGTVAPVVSNGNTPRITAGSQSNQLMVAIGGTGSLQMANAPVATANTIWGNVTGLNADLTNATAATINQLRQAFSVQSIYELDARGGTRYVEILQAHFNVISPDFRLQRPEFLASSTTRFNSHPIAQTAPTSGSNAQGQLAAFATASSNGGGFTKSFVEHGYVLGIMRARADVSYQQGLKRMWSRRTRFEFFWPKLQEIGEQAILKKEIYAVGSAIPGSDDSVLGYGERYAEYRYSPSQIRGQFNSTYTTPLDMWHLAQKYTAVPSLNASFIYSSTPIDRVLAFTTGPDILIDFWFNYKHARPMMTYSVPSTLGRF